MPKLWPIIHSPQVNPLVPGLKLLQLVKLNRMTLTEVNILVVEYNKKS